MKVVQSLEAKSPLAEAEAEGKLKVWTSPEELIEKSVPEVEEARVWLAPVWPFREMRPLPLTIVSQDNP